MYFPEAELHIQKYWKRYTYAALGLWILIMAIPWGAYVVEGTERQIGRNTYDLVLELPAAGKLELDEIVYPLSIETTTLIPRAYRRRFWRGGPRYPKVFTHLFAQYNYLLSGSVRISADEARRLTHDYRWQSFDRRDFIHSITQGHEIPYFVKLETSETFNQQLQSGQSKYDLVFVYRCIDDPQRLNLVAVSRDEPLYAELSAFTP